MAVEEITTRKAFLTDDAGKFADIVIFGIVSI